MKGARRSGQALVLLLLSLPAFCQMKDNRYPPQQQPDRVNLTVTADPSTAMAVTWRTAIAVTSAAAEIQAANPDPSSVKDARRIPALTTLSAVADGKYKELTWKGVTANYHSVVFEGLTPNTLYSYRVGSEGYWSEWFQFRTADVKGKPFSFIYLGDAQTDLYSMWSKVIRQAFTQMPDTRLILHAGDLVNRDDHDEEWGEWFAAGSFIFGMVPNMPSPGNHDYGRGEHEHRLSPFWRPQFTLPENGPEGLEETCYFTDVQGTRFISLDAYMAEESDVFLARQQRWMDSVLRNNPNRWTCVLFHHPIYSPKTSRDNKRMRETFKPLFDRYNVDLVLQGHDHTYARGMAAIPMPEKGRKSGTMYVVSVAGPKMADSGVDKKYWMDKAATHTQLFHVATVDGNRLQFRTYTSAGVLFDSFDLVKQKGKINQLVERMPAR